jgi:hypothetical protein
MLSLPSLRTPGISIGNSLTAGMEGDSLHDDLVAGTGRTWFSRSHTVPGTPLNWHWHDHLGDVRTKAGLPGGNWDALILQPFDRPLYESRAPGSSRYPQGDAWNALNFAREFRASNPGIQTYVYQTFARTPENGNGGVDFAAFDYKAATFYATLFGESPDALDWTVYDDPQNFGRIRTGTIEEIDGIPFFQSFGATEGEREGMAALVNEAVWDVVSGHPYSGVAVIPVPSTWALLVLGTALLLFSTTPIPIRPPSPRH